MSSAEIEHAIDDHDDDMGNPLCPFDGCNLVKRVITQVPEQRAKATGNSVAVIARGLVYLYLFPFCSVVCRGCSWYSVR